MMTFLFWLMYFFIGTFCILAGLVCSVLIVLLVKFVWEYLVEERG